MERLVTPRAPRRGPGDRRRPRHGVGGRRARLHPASAATRRSSRSRPARRSTPEQEQELRDAAVRLALRAGYRERRHRRVPLRARATQRLLVHGGQRAPAGRAPGDRGGHRPRPRQAPAPRRRAAAGSTASRRRASGTRSRRGSTPRTRRSASRPTPGRVAAAAPADRARASASTAASPRATSSRRVRLDDRQGDRLRPRPRRGARAPAPRAAPSTVVVIEGGTTNQGLPARRCSTARRCARARSTPPGSTACGSAAARPSAARTRTSRSCRRRSSSRDDGDRRRARALLRARRAAAGPQADARQRPHDRPAPPRAGLPAARLPARPAAATASTSTASPSSVEVERLGAHERRLTLGGRTHRTLISAPGRRPARRGRRRPAPRHARRRRPRAQPAPAVVVAHPGRAGRRGRGRATSSAVLESMKMETSLTAPFAGRVREVLVGANVQVGAAAPLLRLEPLDGAAATRAAERDRRSRRRPEPPGRRALPRRASPAGWLLLGYDVERRREARCARRARRRPAPAGRRARLLGASADLLGRLRGRARADARRRRGSERELAAQPAGVPARVPALARRRRRAAARSASSTHCGARSRHYGVDEPRPHARRSRTPATGSSVAHQRADDAARRGRSRSSTAGSQRADACRARRRRAARRARPARGRDRGARPGRRRPRARAALSLLRRAARRGARASAVYAEMERAPRARWPPTPTRRTATSACAALVDCPQPLAPLLDALAWPASRPSCARLLLEAMTRRYYRVRALDALRPPSVGGIACCARGTSTTGTRAHAARGRVVELDDLADAAARVRRLAERRAGDVAVVDLYAPQPGRRRRATSSPRSCSAALAAVAAAGRRRARRRRRRRRPARGRGMSGDRRCSRSAAGPTGARGGPRSCAACTR